MPSTVLIAILIFLLADLLLLPILIGVFVRGAFEPLANRFPAAEPEPDAVERRNQSFRINLVNLGWSVHVAVDSRFLHLTPASLFRRIGAKPTSIPWEELEIVRRRGRYVTAKVGSTKITGPEWCFELASVGPDGA